ncbi:hypothetical protein FA95DRAFT_128493 [Auriscalpium vulgare]|uniref:Uncharacterized protein n=1 Tax=Auriscalpium vulgare TaxID=40419 RepID=A0ACB8RMI8_9AGAM|nr:hypothetical protein FA95DRAFT_128493 [Auriscalpium vulgare]
MGNIPPQVFALLSPSSCSGSRVTKSSDTVDTVDSYTSRSPVSLIPPELLSRVFHLLASIDPPSCRIEDSTLSTSFELGWIAVTHVCQHWRQVALEDSALWTNIDFSMLSHKWLTEFFSRISTRALLSVTITSGTFGWLRVKQNYPLLEEGLLFSTDIISRIHSLEFDSSRHLVLFNRLFQHAACTQLPNLEELILRHVDHHPPYMVPTANIPHLRILHLTLVGLDWQTFRLSNIVDLYVYFPSGVPHIARRTSVSDVCDSLAFMTRLERLSLSNIFATQSVASTEIHRTPNVELSVLVTFKLEGSYNDCSALLSRLIMPSLRTLDVHQDPSTFPSSPIRLHSSITPELQRLCLSNAPLDWTSPFPPTLLRLSINHTCLRRDLTSEETLSWYLPELSIFAQRLRATELQTLTLVHATPTITQTPVEDMRINMPDLKTLEIKDSTATVFTLANIFDLPLNSERHIELTDNGVNIVGLRRPSILTGLVKPFDSMDYPPHAMSLVYDTSHCSRTTQQLQLWPISQDWSSQVRLAGSSHPELSIEINSREHLIVDTKAFTDLFLGAVESLSLQCPQWVKPTWHTWLYRTSAVKLLRLSSYGTADVVFQAMMPLGGATDVLFPLLETLVLAFAEMPGYKPEKMLIACARARKAAGFPIREVRLQMNASWVGALRRVVPVVTIGTVNSRAP